MAITRYSPIRIVTVTLGLSAAGAVFGGTAGAAALAIALVATEGLKAFSDLGVFGFAAMVGAVLGAGCAPVAAWLLLRRVPLGRAFGGLTLGTIIGGVIGWFFPESFNPVVQPIATAAAGLLAAAVLLRLKTARQEARIPAINDGAT